MIKERNSAGNNLMQGADEVTKSLSHFSIKQDERYKTQRARKRKHHYKTRKGYTGDNFKLSTSLFDFILLNSIFQCV